MLGLPCSFFYHFKTRFLGLTPVQDVQLVQLAPISGRLARLERVAREWIAKFHIGRV
jgi:hypothetical protein